MNNSWRKTLGKKIKENKLQFSALINTPDMGRVIIISLIGFHGIVNSRN